LGDSLYEYTRIMGTSRYIPQELIMRRVKIREENCVRSHGVDLRESVGELAVVDRLDDLVRRKRLIALLCRRNQTRKLRSRLVVSRIRASHHLKHPVYWSTNGPATGADVTVMSAAAFYLYTHGRLSQPAVSAAKQAWHLSPMAKSLSKIALLYWCILLLSSFKSTSCHVCTIV